MMYLCVCVCERGRERERERERVRARDFDTWLCGHQLVPTFTDVDWNTGHFLLASLMTQLEFQHSVTGDLMWMCISVPETTTPQICSSSIGPWAKWPVFMRVCVCVCVCAFLCVCVGSVYIIYIIIWTEFLLLTAGCYNVLNKSYGQNSWLVLRFHSTINSCTGPHQGESHVSVCSTRELADLGVWMS